jgi:hypothetical protein
LKTESSKPIQIKIKIKKSSTHSENSKDKTAGRKEVGSLSDPLSTLHFLGLST